MINNSTGIAFLTASWISGIVIIKGFWLTVATILLPPFGMYVFFERMMQFFNIL